MKTIRDRYKKTQERMSDLAEKSAVERQLLSELQSECEHKNKWSDDDIYRIWDFKCLDCGKGLN